MVAVSAIETSAIFYKATRDIPENSHYNHKIMVFCYTFFVFIKNRQKQ
jgi:hypothetical protein